MYTFQGTISLKIGTKNKRITLLNVANDITKKRKSESAANARLRRIDKKRSTSSSSTGNISSSDSEMTINKYITSIKKWIEKLLVNINNHVHGNILINITATDFEVIVDSTNGQSMPTCFIQCSCGDRVKLCFHYTRFQLSNLIKHLKTVNNRSTSIINNKTHEIDTPIDSSELSSNEQPVNDDGDLSLSQAISNGNVNIDNQNNVLATIKKS